MNQIPLTNDPRQTMSCILFTQNTNIQLDLTVYWNRIAECWIMDIAQNGLNLLTSIPLLPALGDYVDIIGQWAHLNIGHFFVAPISPSAPDSPGLTDWGTNFALMWGE